MSFSTVTILRHGQTTKVKPDCDRRLTEEGKAQALRRRELLGNPKFDLGMHSPMERTKETLQILAGTNQINTIMVPELIHDNSTPEGKLLDEAFVKFGYAGVDKYLTGSDEPTRKALVNYAMCAWYSIEDVLIKENCSDILIVGHAVLIGLIIMNACEERPENCPALQTNFGECEGAKLTFDEAGMCINIELLVG